MRKIWLYSLLIFTSIACSDNQSLPDGFDGPDSEEEKSYGANNDGESKLSELKVMTYNIHAANPPVESGICDLSAVADVINASDPDIVFLQEVDKNTGRNSYFGNQAKELSKLIQMNYQFFPAIIYKSGYYGIAILSRFPLSDDQKYELPNETGFEQRVLGSTLVDLPGIDSVRVACTHLQNSSASNRIAQIEKVVELLSDESVPVIIGGDFNEKPTTEQFFSIFDNAFIRTCLGTECPYTFSTANPSSTIDYLAFKPQDAFEITSHEVVNETYASDHFPVMATFRFTR